MSKQVLLLPLILLGLNAQAAPPIEHWLTDNGARVYFVETHQLPMVDVTVGFDGGSARDPQEKPGLAHLVNVLMAEGAGGMDEHAIALELESAGAQYGNENGRDMSIFQLRSLSDRALFQRAVDVFAKIVTQPSFPASALQRERQRTLVELKQEKQSAREVAERAFYSALFGSHPYARATNGEESGIDAVTRADLVEFHRRYMVGANAVVAIVGDLSRKEAAALAQTIVGGLPRGESAPMVERVAEPKGEYRHIEFPSNQTHLMMGLPGVSRGDPDYFPLYVGNHILGGSGLISRLAVEIREKRGLAYSVYSYFVPMRERGPFVIGLQTRNDQSELAERLVRETVSRFVQQGPSPDELVAAQKNITGGFPLALDSNKKIAGYLLMIGFYGLPLDYLETFPEKIDAVTIEEVRDAFRRRVDPDRLVRVVVGGARS